MTIKLENIEQVYLNGKKATTFQVYELISNSWVYQYSDAVKGHYKKESTILKKIKSKTIIELINENPL